MDTIIHGSANSRSGQFTAYYLTSSNGGIAFTIVTTTLTQPAMVERVADVWRANIEIGISTSSNWFYQTEEPRTIAFADNFNQRRWEMPSVPIDPTDATSIAAEGLIACKSVTTFVPQSVPALLCVLGVLPAALMRYGGAFVRRWRQYSRKLRVGVAAHIVGSYAFFLAIIAYEFVTDRGAAVPSGAWPVIALAPISILSLPLLILLSNSGDVLDRQTVFASATYVAVFVAVAYRRGRRSLAEQRMAAGCCAACGYDLRATPERCPECGAVPGAVPHNVTHHDTCI